MIALSAENGECLQTVLVVENDKVSRKLLNAVLSRNYRTLIVEDGAAAMDVIDHYAGSIDLLLTDLMVPHTTGEVLARHMRQCRPNAKVLYMSGYTLAALPFLGIKLDGELLEKPLSVHYLRDRVSQVLSQA